MQRIHCPWLALLIQKKGNHLFGSSTCSVTGSPEARRQGACGSSGLGVVCSSIFRPWWVYMCAWVGLFTAVPVAAVVAVAAA